MLRRTTVFALASFLASAAVARDLETPRFPLEVLSLPAAPTGFISTNGVDVVVD